MKTANQGVNRSDGRALLLALLFVVGIAVWPWGCGTAHAEGAAVSAKPRLLPRQVVTWQEPARDVLQQLSVSKTHLSLTVPQDLVTRSPGVQAAGAPTPSESGAGGAQAPSGNDTESLTQAAQNPLAAMTSIPFQNNINFKSGPYDRTQNIMNIQPVVPLKLNAQWNMVLRVIVPVTNQPSPTTPEGTVFGLGDINPTLFFTPSKGSKVIWGVGPSFFFPTATDKSLGSGKWSAGPSVVGLVMPGDFVIGVLAANYWSFAGESGRSRVNTFVGQLFANYNFPKHKGLYLTSAPIFTANWNAPSGEQWTVPVGGGIGKVTKVGTQNINVQIGAYYNAIRPTHGAEWQLRLQLNLLYPKGK